MHAPQGQSLFQPQEKHNVKLFSGRQELCAKLETELLSRMLPAKIPKPHRFNF